MRHEHLAALAFCLLVSADPLFAQIPSSAWGEGLIHADLVVNDAEGKPVGGLDEQDFRLLEDGKERAALFEAHGGVQAKAKPGVQMILAGDSVNNGFVEQGDIRHGLTKFLHQNNGQLAQQTSVPNVPEKLQITPLPQPPSAWQRSSAKGPEPLRAVTVALLTEIIGEVKRRRDSEAAKEIERLQLTQRLSSPRLARLSAELPGAKAKSALLAVGDASVFLMPPSDEIPPKARPALTDQNQMMSLVLNYLAKTIPKLPDFYARRITTSFEKVWTPKKDGNGKHNGYALHPGGVFKATVYFRSGKEVVHEDGAQEHGLITRGTFGPILSTIMIDAAHSNTMQWSRWEQGPDRPMAVFRWQVPPEKSHYAVSGTEGLGAMGKSAYHGEIGIDPKSGAILRLILEADPGLGSSLSRADIMVEYGPVAIGGKTYTCPVRSVSYGVGSSVSLEAALGMGLDQEVIRLNDVVFSDYHVFRSEMRIIP